MRYQVREIDASEGQQELYGGQLQCFLLRRDHGIVNAWVGKICQHAIVYPASDVNNRLYRYTSRNQSAISFCQHILLEFVQKHTDVCIHWHSIYHMLISQVT